MKYLINLSKLNQLTNSTNPINLKTYLYDDDGNMTQGYAPEGYLMAMTYDAENRMTSAEYTDSSLVVHRTEYVYSGYSLLAEMKKYDGGTLTSTIRYLRAGFLPAQERDSTNAVTREYTWGLNLGGGIGGLLNLRQNSSDYTYLYDGKGNVASLINSSQSVVANYGYDPFGVLMKKTATIEQPYMFSTKPYDEKLGVLKYEYRTYMPEPGKWTTRDPLGEFSDFNLYNALGNNAVNLIDPFGFSSQDRVRWVLTQYKNNKDTWKGGRLGRRNKCNEFVAAAHIYGDPDVLDYPTVLRDNDYTLPTVADLADPTFAQTQLDYLPIDKVQPGDIIIWYGGETHHSAIFIGNDQVIYQHPEKGLKINTVEGTKRALKFKDDPIVRRYRY